MKKFRSKKVKEREQRKINIQKLQSENNNLYELIEKAKYENQILQIELYLRDINEPNTSSDEGSS